MELIDTHVHISFDAYNDDRVAMMQRAYENGVKTMVHSCCNLDEVSQLAGLCKEYNGNNSVNLYHAIGVHPIEVEKWEDGTRERFAKCVEDELAKQDNKLRAIGETGMDYYHITKKEDQEKQALIFKDQIDIAKKHKLPIIVHTRDAFDDTLKILQEKYNKDSVNSGIIHCYTGDLEFAKACIEIGFYISWSGIVTYKKTDNLREVAKELPLEKTLIETDCPYLAPQKVRGERNEPSYVNYVAETLADCYQVSKEEITKQTTQNAKKVFNLN